MTVKDAVAKRFRQICKERSIKPNELANRAGITPSSVYSMLDPKRREVSVNLVKKLRNNYRGNLKITEKQLAEKDIDLLK